MRAFAARRSGGARAHAGIDLYFPDFTPVRALADGVVTRGPHAFYLKTFALEVDHGPFLARYGELAPETTWPVQTGDAVARGQVLGRVGILKQSNGRRLDVPSMMLHLELYDKTEQGALTRAVGTSARSMTGVPFLRRRDLIDPSGFVARAALP
jgi:murein DD-endopeptidase MepM/ murein hydrolase activator NlpD